MRSIISFTNYHIIVTLVFVKIFIIYSNAAPFPQEDPLRNYDYDTQHAVFLVKSKSTNPVPQRDKLKSKSRSWHCDTCRDTNSFKRKDRTKRWRLSLNLEDMEDILDGQSEEDQSKSMDIVSPPTESTSSSTFSPEDCKTFINTNQSHVVSVSTEVGKALIVSLIPSRAIFSIFWFVLGMITTIIAHHVIMKYIAYMKKHIDSFIEQLEAQCLVEYRSGNYIEVVQLLVSNIPYVINYRGSRHLDTASFQHLLAKAYLSLSNIHAAECLLNDVRAIYEPLGRDYHLANVLEDMGTVYYAKQNYEDALDYYIAALDIHVDNLSGIPSAAELSSPTLRKSFSSDSPSKLPTNSLKYEEKYRRNLIKKAFQDARISFPKTPKSANSSTTKKFASPRSASTTSTDCESPEFVHSSMATNNKNHQNSNNQNSNPNSNSNNNNNNIQKTPVRSLNDQFELECDSDFAVRELEDLLSTPDITVSPITNESPEGNRNSSSNNGINGINGINNNNNSNGNSIVAEGYPVNGICDIPATPDTIRLHHSIGKVLYNQGRYPTALEYYTISLEMLMNTGGPLETIEELKMEIESVSQILKFSASTSRRRVRFSPDILL